MATLNGWQRLWVVVTVLWALVVLGFGYDMWQEFGDHMLRYHNWWSRQGVASFAGRLLMSWALPPVFLYAFGWSAVWIRRGCPG